MNMIDLKFFKKAYNFHGIGVFCDGPFEKENSKSFILTNPKLDFEPYEFNLIE